MYILPFFKTKMKFLASVVFELQ